MTKTEYIAARTAWKQNYAELTLKIREAKASRRDTFRAISKHPYISTYFNNIPQGWTKEQVSAHMEVWYKLNFQQSCAVTTTKNLRQEAQSKMEALENLKAAGAAAWLAKRSQGAAT